MCIYVYIYIHTYCVIEDCKTELHKLLEEERLLGATLLVFANKQDLPGALGMDEIREVKIIKLVILEGIVGELIHGPRLKSSQIITGVHNLKN